MAELLVAHNFHQPLDPNERAAGKPYPPLGTLTSAAELERSGVDLAVYDPTFAGEPELFAAALDGHHPRRVALVMDPHAIPQKMCTTTMRAAAQTMILAARARGIPVFASGPDVSDHPECYAEAEVVVRGDHDQALADWVSGAKLPPIVATGSPRVDLAGLPNPAWEQVDMARYARAWRERHGYWEVNLATARGCPYRCNWCAKPTWGRTYHVRPVEDVVAEVEALRDRFGPDRIWFTDDIFAIRPAWLSAYRAAMERRPLPFRCLSRADLLKDESYVADLRAAGCVEVWLGAESGSDRVLEAMDKDSTVAEIRRASDLLQAHGIRRGFFLQLGYPGETPADVEATRRLVHELRPEEIGISVSYPLPGTVFHERMKHRLRAANWSGSMENRLLFDADLPQAFYDAAREVLRAEHALVNFRPEFSRRGLRRGLGAAWHLARWPYERARMYTTAHAPGQ